MNLKKQLLIYTLFAIVFGVNAQVDEVFREKLTASVAQMQSLKGTFTQEKTLSFLEEPITSYGDSLLIFTKNWDNKKTRVYSLPKKAGTYEINTQQSCEVNGLVTGASYNPTLNTLVLIGYIDYRPFLVINRAFTGYFDTNSKRIKIKKKRYTQTEGISLVDDGTIYISSERTKAFPQKIYRLALDKIRNN